jgi:hypothetical protein
MELHALCASAVTLTACLHHTCFRPERQCPLVHDRRNVRAGALSWGPMRASYLEQRRR